MRGIVFPSSIIAAFGVKTWTFYNKQPCNVVPNTGNLRYIFCYYMFFVNFNRLTFVDSWYMEYGNFFSGIGQKESRFEKTQNL